MKEAISILSIFIGVLSFFTLTVAMGQALDESLLVAIILAIVTALLALTASHDSHN